MTSKKILIISIGKKLGDNITDTFLIHYLKRLYPAAQITLLMHEGYRDVFIHNPDVARIITVPNTHYFGKLFGNLWKLRQEHFDIVIDIFFPLTRKKVLFDWILGAQNVFAVNSSGCKCVTHSIKAEPTREHILVRMLKVLQCLKPGFDAPFQYFLYPSQEVMHQVESELPKKQILFFNPTASDERRTLPETNVRSLLQHFAGQFPQMHILLSYPREIPGLPVNTTRVPYTNLETLFTLIKSSDAVLSVDTGIVHVASAFDKPQVVLYARPISEYRPDLVFAPICKNKILLHSSDTVGSIENKQIAAALEKIICH